MSLPTPLNESARDDRFNRGLERLLAGNPAGVVEIEPDLQDITIEMVQLATMAGWIGSAPAERDLPLASPQRNWRSVTNAVAAVAVIGLVIALTWYGLQMLPNHGGDQYGSGGDEIVLGAGACQRVGRTNAEIAAIVRSSEDQVYPFASGGTKSDPVLSMMQTMRDWSACLADGKYRQATAYESPHLIWSFGQQLFPNGTTGLTDVEIATAVLTAHSQIASPSEFRGENLSLYSVEYWIGGDTSDDPRVGMTAWLVPLDEDANWIVWPVVVSIEWDGSQWVIVSTSQDGIPDSPYKPSDNNPEMGTPAAE